MMASKELSRNANACVNQKPSFQALALAAFGGFWAMANFSNVNKIDMNMMIDELSFRKPEWVLLEMHEGFCISAPHRKESKKLWVNAI